MSQRNSGYARQPNDTYVTPRWVYEALYKFEPWAKEAWDCAPEKAGFDFLQTERPGLSIATNPPFSLATEFCRHAIKYAPKVAMLLSVDFDSAKTRSDLFSKSEIFAAKYILTKRIRWENLVQLKSGPSQNHAWYVWDKNHAGSPILGWLP